MAQEKESLRQRWNSLQTPPAGLTHAALAKWKRNRGYELEKLIVDLARSEELDAALPYRGKGEQIDGYFVVNHQHFLLEAKWQENPATASEVYAFQGKMVRVKMRAAAQRGEVYYTYQRWLDTHS